MNKGNLLPALKTHFPLIFLSIFFMAEEVALFAILGKSTQAKGIARSNNTLFLDYLRFYHEIYLIELFYPNELY